MNSKNDDGWSPFPKGVSDGWRFAISIIMLFFYLIALPFHLLMLTVGYLRDIIRYLKKPPPPFNNTPQLEQDTRNLVEKLKPNALTKDDPLHPENYTYSLLMQLKSDHTPSFALIDAVSHVIFPLIEQERFLEVPIPTPTDDIVEQAKYRDELRAVITKHRNFIETKRAFDDAIIESMNAFIKALPPAAFCMEGNTTIALEDLIENPQKLLWDIISPFYDNTSHQRNLFKTLTDQIDENVRKQKDVLPQDAQGTTTELFNKYLYNTPLRNIINAQIPFNIPRSAWVNHAIIAAPSGHGKTMTLGSIIYDFLQEADPPAIFVIEPHNDLIAKLQHLAVFNERLKDRLVVLDPADSPALNFLDVGEDMSAGVVESFKYLMSSLSSDLTKKQETASAYILMLTRKIPDATIDTLREIMDEKVRNITQSKFYPYIQQLETHARDFFANQFYSGNMAETRLQVSQRLYTVLANDAFRRMFAAPKNTFSAFDAMQAKKIVLVNASRDELQKQGAAIFGRWMLTQIMTAAFKRPKHARHLCLVVLDEAHLYFDSSTETILSELRKFGVGLCAATQFLDQIEDRVKSAIYANTAIKMSGPVSHSDANSLAKEMYTTSEFIRSCKMVDRKHAEFALYTKAFPKAIKITIPFGVIEDAPTMSNEEHKALRQRNRERYGTSSSANVNHENSLSQTHEAPAKKPSNEVPPLHPTSVSTTPPPAPNPAVDPHAGIDD